LPKNTLKTYKEQAENPVLQNGRLFAIDRKFFVVSSYFNNALIFKYNNEVNEIDLAGRLSLTGYLTDMQYDAESQTIITVCLNSGKLGLVSVRILSYKLLQSEELDKEGSLLNQYTSINNNDLPQQLKICWQAIFLIARRSVYKFSDLNG